MKSRLFLRNSASLVLLLSTTIALFCGCTSSTSPTFIKENAEDAIKDILAKEYQITVVTHLVKQTLWVYLPLNNVIAKAEKPQKYVERFVVDEDRGALENGTLKFSYLIKGIPEEEKTQETQYDKKAVDKIQNVWKVIRRVIFSMAHSQRGAVKFICIITADTDNGAQIRETVFIEDLKKVAYNFISWEEFQHRVIQETEIARDIIGDTQGQHVNYRDVSFEEFLVKQIENRIKLKFQKPEVEKGADIDKEILKAIQNTLDIYKFYDFDALELYNGDSKKRLILSPAAVKNDAN